MKETARTHTYTLLALMKVGYVLNAFPVQQIILYFVCSVHFPKIPNDECRLAFNTPLIVVFDNIRIALSVYRLIG